MFVFASGTPYADQLLACDIALIENNGVAPKLVATPFWSNFFVFPLISTTVVSLVSLQG